MKKIFILVLALALTLMLLAKLVTRVFTSTVNVDAQLEVLENNFSNPKLVGHWLAPFNLPPNVTQTISNEMIKQTGAQLQLQKINPLLNLYKKTKGNDTVKFSITIVPDTAQYKLQLKYESTLFQYFFPDENRKELMNSFNQLPIFFTNSSKQYGYDIKMIPVTDSTFLFSKINTTLALKFNALHLLFTHLIEFAAQKKAAYNGTRIFFISPNAKDSITINAGIGISNTLQFNNFISADILFKRMPYQKNLLTAFYQGSFKDIDLVYPALLQFKTDQKLTGIAMPFTKIITEGTLFSEEQTIQAEICYPVF